MADAKPADVKAKHSWVWLVVLVVGGAVGIYLAAPEISVLHAAWARLSEVPVAAIAIVLGGAIGLVATEALRIAVIGRIVGVHVRPRDAWDAAVANHVMTAVTPQVGLGEPTVAYTLAKRGVAWDAAVAIPFIKFTTSLALVFVIGTVLVVAGFTPPIERGTQVTAIVWFGGIAAITIVVIAVVSSERVAGRWIARLAGWGRRRRLLARWQAGITRAEQVALRTVARLARVRTGQASPDDAGNAERMSPTTAVVDGSGEAERMSPVAAVDGMSGGAVEQLPPAAAMVALAAVHLVYYASYIAPLVGLALVLGDPPLVTLCLRALVYLCFVFAMPTPGGVGPSEAAAGWFFGDLVAPADALVLVVVFRASTFYLQLAIGALYLPIRSLARSRT